MKDDVIAVEYRGDTLENIHQGLLCIVDEHTNVIYEKGDINQPVYYRSAMKPIQAIPVFTTDVINKYGITSEEAALFTASQRGESYHEKSLISLSEKLDLNDEDLLCAKSYPLNEEPKLNYILAHKPKRELMHNCAGKHLGFLAYAKERNYNLASYTGQNHPLQQQILDYVANLSETPKEDMHIGMDGCGAPIYAVPLKNMAISFLKFVVPELIANESTRSAVIEIGNVMNAHPNIVASHDFICSALLEDSNIIAKGGAQGVYCFSLRKEKVSIALKVLSGTELLWPLIIVEILKKINYSNVDTINRLLKLKSQEINSDAGEVIGHTEIIL